MASSRRFVAVLFELSAGPLAWATHLGAVYGVTAVVCARPGLRAEGLVVPMIAGLTAAALAVAGWALLRATRRVAGGGQDLDVIAAALAGFSVVAIAWDGVPALMVPVCG